MDRVTYSVGPVLVQMLPGCRVAARAEHGEPFEPESLALWAEIVTPGRAALDVGAYTGLYAIAAAKLGALAYAFEPLPEQGDRLQANAELNAVKLTLHRVAIADTSGAAEFRFNAQVPLTSGGSLVGKGMETATVITRRLDDLDLPPVAAIKIDVERAEGKVLKGAARLLSRNRPEIIAEVLNLEDVHKLEALCPGYRMRRVLDDRNAWLSPL